MSEEARDRDEHEDDAEDEPVAAEATTADDDEGEIGERNVGGP